MRLDKEVLLLRAVLREVKGGDDGLFGRFVHAHILGKKHCKGLSRLYSSQFRVRLATNTTFSFIARLYTFQMYYIYIWPIINICAPVTEIFVIK